MRNDLPEGSAAVRIRVPDVGDKGAVALGAIIAATEQMALHEPLGLAAALQNPITVLGLHRVARVDPGPLVLVRADAEVTDMSHDALITPALAVNAILLPKMARAAIALIVAALTAPAAVGMYIIVIPTEPILLLVVRPFKKLRCPECR